MTYDFQAGQLEAKTFLSHGDFLRFISAVSESHDDFQYYQYRESLGEMFFDVNERNALVRERGRCVIALDAAVQTIVSMHVSGSYFRREGLNQKGKIVDFLKGVLDTEFYFQEQTQRIISLAEMACVNSAELLMREVEMPRSDSSTGLDICGQVERNQGLADDANLLIRDIYPMFVQVRSFFGLEASTFPLPEVPQHLRGAIFNRPIGEFDGETLEGDNLHFFPTFR